MRPNTTIADAGAGRAEARGERAPLLEVERDDHCARNVDEREAGAGDHAVRDVEELDGRHVRAEEEAEERDADRRRSSPRGSRSGS